MGGQATYYYPLSCDDYHAIQTVQAVEGLFECIAGVAGIIGFCGYIACLMLVPAAYSVLAVIGTVVILVMLGVSNIGLLLTPILGLGIALLIALLFVANYKLMKDTDPKGSV